MKRKAKCAAAALAVLIAVIAAWYGWPRTLEALLDASLENCQQAEVYYWRDMSPYTNAAEFILTPEDSSFPLLLPALREQTFSRFAYGVSANNLLPETAFRWSVVLTLADGTYLTVDEGFNQPTLHYGSRHWRVRAADQSRWRVQVRDILLGSQGVQPR